MNYEPPTTNYKTCQFCDFGNDVAGLAEGILICDYPGAGEGCYTATGPSDCCQEFTQARRGSDIAALAAQGDGGTRLIPLTKSEFAIVDAADYDKVSKYYWRTLRTSSSSYAITTYRGKYLHMHRLITAAPKGLVVDHIDHNGLNNTRNNLRLCTAKQNNYNSRPRKGSTSKYKGVSWKTASGKFVATIRYDRKQYHLGYFTDEEQAARTYDKKAKELFGEFAYLNFKD